MGRVGPGAVVRDRPLPCAVGEGGPAAGFALGAGSGNRKEADGRKRRERASARPRRGLRGARGTRPASHESGAWCPFPLPRRSN